MNILMIGPAQYNSTDGVIISGIKYLLNKAFGDHFLMYVELQDAINQTQEDYLPDGKFDLIVVAGTPWLWDSFQNSIKFKNLLLAFSAHPKAKRLFMGIGSCLYLEDTTTELLERPNEQAAMLQAFGDATVIVRDRLALDRLSKAGVMATLLPCPAYYCYGDQSEQPQPTDNILIFQDPTKSISASNWQDLAKLDAYYKQMRDFVVFHKADIYCAHKDDLETATALGFTPIKQLVSVNDTLTLMRKARYVLSGRVHCAVPAIVQGASVTLMPLDTRSYVVEDFKHIKDFKPYVAEYIKVLQSIFKPRKVGTESQRTYEHFKSNGFFAKYMSGVGLDIGYAGYTDGVQPILPTAIGIDIDYPGYDGKTLPFADGSQDYIYSSHCLEHIADYRNAIKEWFRVTKIGGHIVITVPHQFLYEKRQALPSKWNADHKRFYTPASLLAEVERTLVPNSYRVILLEDGDKGFNYDRGPDTHSSGQYEILLVLKKIQLPTWTLA